MPTGVSAEDEDLNQVIAASLEDHAAVAAVHGDGAGTSQGTTRTAVGAGLGGALGDDEAALEAAIAASLGELPLAAGPSGAQPNGANTAMDDVAVVGSRLGGAAEGDDAQPGSVAAPKGMFCYPILCSPVLHTEMQIFIRKYRCSAVMLCSSVILCQWEVA